MACAPALRENSGTLAVRRCGRPCSTRSSLCFRASLPSSLSYPCTSQLHRKGLKGGNFASSWHCVKKVMVKLTYFPSFKQQILCARSHVVGHPEIPPPAASVAAKHLLYPSSAHSSITRWFACTLISSTFCTKFHAHVFSL